MRITLIHPPLDDPTLPYHSTAYLKGHLMRNGFSDVLLRDVNIEYVNHLLQPATMDALYEEGLRVSADLRRTGALDFEAQERYYGFLAAGRPDTAGIRHAAEQLRDRKAFLDFPRYVKNLDAITGYIRFLGALSYPSEYLEFAQWTRGRYSLASLRDLLSPNLGPRVCHPFEQYFEQSIAQDPGFASTDLFGISIVYDHHLYHALHLARLLRRRWPSKRIVFGGTAISQLFKYLKVRSRIKELFELCDAIVVGEGETAICEIAASGGDFENFSFTNTITYRKDKDLLRLPVIRYENMTELGAPQYDHPWDLYLSPERGINYSPTRGCYWNRCTFCDYGLNTDKPTSPWRERKIPQVIEDLTRAHQDFGVRYVYFAVDVMAPGYLERLADAIIDARLEIRWSAEMRLEKIFSEERVRKMKQAGCVCVSFGMESGNQRILDLIDKGTKVKFMPITMKNFSDAGIACQLMAFTDFPTETAEEKAATFQFIRDNEAYWSAGGVGTFMLTGTAMIAKDPAKFGITLIETEGADITRALAYRMIDGVEKKLTLTEEKDASFDETGGVFPPILGRPWAGGTDSLHSMIYYDRYGANFFKRNPPHPGARILEMTDELALRCSIAVEGALVTSNLDLSVIVANRRRFLAYRDERVGRPSEPTYDAFHEWQNGIPKLETMEGPENCWLVTWTRCTKLDKLVFRILQDAAERPAPIAELISSSPLPMQGKLLTYFRNLEANGIISFQLGAEPIRSEASAGAEEQRRIRMGTPEKIKEPLQPLSPPPRDSNPLVVLA